MSVNSYVNTFPCVICGSEYPGADDADSCFDACRRREDLTKKVVPMFLDNDAFQQIDRLMALMAKYGATRIKTADIEIDRADRSPTQPEPMAATREPSAEPDKRDDGLTKEDADLLFWSAEK